MGWDWGIVLGIAGLLLAVIFGASIFQMFGGAAKLVAGFDARDDRNCRQLVFHLTNAPVGSRVLRMLRVYRQPADVTVAFKIEELTGGEVAYVTKPMVRAGKTQEQPVALPANSFMGVLVLAHASDAFVLRAETDMGVRLKPGTYKAHFVVVSNDRNRIYERQFVVGADRSKTQWIN